MIQAQIECAPVDCSQHMENMRNDKQNKRKIQKGAIAMQRQLSQMSVPHHGPAHLAASIEQHAHMLSTVVTKDSSTDTWEADWRRRPKAHAKVRRQAARRPMKRAALRTKQTTRVMPVTMDQMDNPSTWLHLNVDPHARGCIPSTYQGTCGVAMDLKRRWRTSSCVQIQHPRT